MNLKSRESSFKDETWTNLVKDYGGGGVLMNVLYFDQLLGAVHTRKLVETLFSAVVNLFCLFTYDGIE